MGDSHTDRASTPDALISWTTSVGLIALGVIYFDDAVIMGRTILPVGVLSGTDEALKF